MDGAEDVEARMRSARKHWLRPGALFVVDDDARVCRTLERVARSLGPGYSAESATDLRELEQKLLYPERVDVAGRARVRGFLVDFFLDADRRVTALDVLDRLDRLYPRTPVVIFTGSSMDPTGIESRCIEVGRTWRKAPSSASDAGWSPAIPASLRRAIVATIGPRRIGRVTPPGRSVWVLDRLELRREVLEWLDEMLFFAPWDAERVEIRSLLVEMAGPNVTKVSEALLTMLDAAFESAPPSASKKCAESRRAPGRTTPRGFATCGRWTSSTSS